MSTLDEMMGWDPKSVNTFEDNSSQRQEDENLYKVHPKDSKSDDGVYRSKIRLLHTINHIPTPIVQQQSYWFKDAKGTFSAISSLSNGDKSCPIYKAFMEIYYNQKKPDFAKQYFSRQTSNFIGIQVIEDENRPELNGKLMYWKIPKSVRERLDAKMNPSGKGKYPFQLLDPLFGSVLELEVKIAARDGAKADPIRDVSYDLSDFDTTEIQPIIKTDGTNFFTSEQIDTIEAYHAVRTKAYKLDPEARDEKIKTLTNSDEAKEIKELYQSAIDYLKDIQPNIVELMSYKPWADSIKERVTAYLDNAVKGINPETAIPETAVNAADGGEFASMVGNSLTESEPSPADEEDAPF